MQDIHKPYFVYETRQRQGERISGPPLNWIGPPPPKGSEAHITGFPRDVYEKVLLPFLGKAGTIYRLRLKMDFSGSNRGYAFVEYSSPDVMHSAINMLNHTEILPGYMVTLKESIDNRRLVFSKLPAFNFASELANILNPLVDSILEVKLLNDAEANKRNAIVSFESHQAAAKARRELVPYFANTAVFKYVNIFWAPPDIHK